MPDHLSWWQWLLLAVWGPTTAVALVMMAGVAARATADRIRHGDRIQRVRASGKMATPRQ